MNMLVRFFILMSLLKQQFPPHKPNHKTTSNQGKTSVTKPMSTEMPLSTETPLGIETLSAPFIRSHRILPHDMGFRDHLPNYRFLSFIELNITGWIYQMFALKGRDSSNIKWIISMQEMVYLNEVKLFDKMTVSSKLEGWDAKYVYFQHHFYVKNKLMAIGLTKLVLVADDVHLPPEVLDLKDKHHTDVISTWNANQVAIKAQ